MQNFNISTESKRYDLKARERRERGAYAGLRLDSVTVDLDFYFCLNFRGERDALVRQSA